MPGPFARLRWSLTSDVLRCLALERPRLTRLENTRDLLNRCDQDERAFREHVARWPAAAMQTPWREYERESRAMRRLVEARLCSGQVPQPARASTTATLTRLAWPPIPWAGRRP